tara:strand:- start:2522 stop:4051 length:1530 start_codon:yes stop_codon:yes gene_type:complete
MVHFIAPKPLAQVLENQSVKYEKQTPSLINGERVIGTGSSWDVIYPATEEVLGSCSSASVEQVDHAVSSAKAAFDQGIWRTTTLAHRQGIFYKISELFQKYAHELAVLQALETGIPYKQFKGMHAVRASENFRFFSDVATSLSGKTFQQTGRYLSLTLQQPIGVGLVISPWNAPLILAGMKIAACLISGNSCIVKPSEYTPLSQLRMVEIIIEAGVPAQVIHLLNGTGAVTGAALTLHTDIDAINFVGGTETGKRIMKSAADGLKKISLELGGKSANIIIDDCDIDAAIDGSLLGIFAGNGEQCLAGSRILIQSSIYDEVVEKMVERTKNLRIGDPFEDVEIGPLAFKTHHNRVLDFTTKAVNDGDEILCGGGVPDAADSGYFFEPVMACAKSNSTRICQEEIFGPFAALIKFETLEEAIEMANDSDFGLVSYVWTQDIDNMMKFAQQVRAGTVWVNTAMSRDLRAPFGGYKLSGLGRDGLEESIHLFTEEKTVMIPAQKLAFPKLGLG